MQHKLVTALLMISAFNLFGSSLYVAGRGASDQAKVFSTLDSLGWEFRPLVVFAPSDRDHRFLHQTLTLANAPQPLRDRQVVFVPLTYKKYGRPSRTMPFVQQAVSFPDAEASELRQRFGVAPGEFTVILIGKDGGEKFRAHAPVTIDRLNAVIDAMPMRQQEVRDGNSK